MRRGRDLRKVRSNQPRTAAVRFSCVPPGNTDSAAVLTVRSSSASLSVCVVPQPSSPAQRLQSGRIFRVEELGRGEAWKLGC